MRFNITPVVKVILIMNIGILLLDALLGALDVNGILSLYYFESKKFLPFQYITYMFGHAGFRHLLGNMLGLIIFGPMLEERWGSSRFLFFFLATGFGGALLHTLINIWDITDLKNAVEAYTAHPSEEDFYSFIHDRASLFVTQMSPFLDEFEKNPTDSNYLSQSIIYARQILQAHIDGIPMLGASGAVLGVAVAFGIVFANMEILLWFIPFPIKGKYLALIYAGPAIYGIISSAPRDNVAHFAHLGGMIFAVIIVQYWKTRRDTFY